MTHRWVVQPFKVKLISLIIIRQFYSIECDITYTIITSLPEISKKQGILIYCIIVAQFAYIMITKKVNINYKTHSKERDKNSKYLYKHWLTSFFSSSKQNATTRIIIKPEGKIVNNDGTKPKSLDTHINRVLKAFQRTSLLVSQSIPIQPVIQHNCISGWWY